MNRPLPSFRVCLCASLIFLPALLRAQVITDAFNTSVTTNWIGAVGDSVNIFGSGFTGASSVKFNGTAAAFGVSSDSQISLIGGIPAGATTGLISVTKAGNTAFSSQNFQIIAPGPYVMSFSPVGGGGGTAVILRGVRLSNVNGTNGILFNGKKAIAATISSANQISGTAPPGVTTGPITVMAIAGVIGTNITSSNYFGPSVITSFSPSSGRANTNVIISGTNFTGATAVLFNGVSATPYVVNNNNQITATVPASATTGTITLLAPGGGFATASNFFILPTITSFLPANGVIGTRVTINGANFIGTPTVKFNGITATGVVVTNSTLLGATVPSTATTGPITVTTTDGTATSLTLFYLPPFITSFSPTNSAPGTTVTITGTNFTDTSSLKFNGATASFFNVTSNSLQVTVPTNFTTGPLTLITPGGTNVTTSIARSNFYAAPIITSFSPTHGLPGVNVAIFGTNFLGTTQITFNGLAGTSLIVSNNNAVRITVPALATTGPLVLTAPAGTNNAGTFFLDYAPGLNISISTPPLLLLSWPVTFYTYALQTNANLTLSSAWTNVLTPPTIIGGSNFVTETNLGAMMFYRLKR